MKIEMERDDIGDYLINIERHMHVATSKARH